MLTHRASMDALIDHIQAAEPRLWPGHTGHAHFWDRALSRRQFVLAAAGTTAGLALLPGVAAAAAEGGAAKPIPGGLDLLGLITGTPGPTFHVFFPAFKQEVSTITDFNGFIAAAEIQGTGTANNGARLTFDADMRFMDGVYVDVAGRTSRGTFGFIWLDLFTGQFAQQIHDFNPGITPNGVFWTERVPRSTTDINLGLGTASFRMTNLAIDDYGDIINSLTDTTPPIPSRTSFDVQWQSKSRGLTAVTDSTNRFTGEFADSTATIAWSASQATTGFTFTSDPASSSRTVSGVIGHELNGKFFS